MSGAQLRLRGLSHAYGLRTVLDHIDLELPAGRADWLREQVPAIMAGVAQLKVPLLAEVGVGANWEEAH